MELTFTVPSREEIRRRIMEPSFPTLAGKDRALCMMCELITIASVKVAMYADTKEQTIEILAELIDDALTLHESATMIRKK